jgi:hypothetical protein
MWPLAVVAMPHRAVGSTGRTRRLACNLGHAYEREDRHAEASTTPGRPSNCDALPATGAGRPKPSTRSCSVPCRISVSQRAKVPAAAPFDDHVVGPLLPAEKVRAVPAVEVDARGRVRAFPGPGRQDRAAVARDGFGVVQAAWRYSWMIAPRTSRRSIRVGGCERQGKATARTTTAMKHPPHIPDGGPGRRPGPPSRVDPVHR